MMSSIEVTKIRSKLEVGGGNSRHAPGRRDALVFCRTNAAYSHR